MSLLTAMPLLDADDEIVLRAGKPIHQIFQESGEAAFRELEREVTTDLCSASGNVIAAGGGAFVDPEIRELMLTSGLVFCLSARPETIHRRIAESSDQKRKQGSQQDIKGETESPVRPLLSGDDPMGRIKTLLDQRAYAYAQAHYIIDTDRLTPEQVAGRILGLCSAATAVNGE